MAAEAKKVLHCVGPSLCAGTAQSPCEMAPATKHGRPFPPPPAQHLPPRGTKSSLSLCASSTDKLAAAGSHTAMSALHDFDAHEEMAAHRPDSGICCKFLCTGGE